MAHTIHLEIVTPEGRALDAEVLELTAPGVEGEFGVLPRHRPLLAGLRTGIVRYRLEGGGSSQVQAVAIGPGFAKVEGDRVSILTDRYLAKSGVDAVVARKDLKEAESGFSMLPVDATLEAKKALVSQARWAAVRLELYGDPPPPTVVVALETRLLASEGFGVDAISGPEPSGAPGATGAGRDAG
jgi:F-type H+-transporting ATPase subunit epsilon